MITNRILLSVLLGAALLNTAEHGCGQENIRVHHELNTFNRQDRASGEILIRLKAGDWNSRTHRINQRFDTSSLSMGARQQYIRLRIPSGQSQKNFIQSLNNDPDVEYAEPNYIAHAMVIPDDPFYPYQWHLDNPVTGGVHTQAAWNITTGDPGVIVAVLDTGVAYENYGVYVKAPDFAGTSFVAGYDFVHNDAHANDDNSHGTHMAGTIAQSTNNALGTAGIAYHTTIMPVKVLDQDGYGTVSDIADGIYYAVDHGADVINLSLGLSSPSVTLQNALIYAYNHGVTCVCSAGNEYEQGNPPQYPASYNQYCIAVGATRFDETRAYYSNTGGYVNLAAPGGDNTVDQNADGFADGILQETINPYTGDPADLNYWLFVGTSSAAAHVSGVAALLIAGGVTGAPQVREALESTADDLGIPGRDDLYGYGLVNAQAALSYFPSPVHDILLDGISMPAVIAQGTVADVHIQVSNPGNYSEYFSVTLTDVTDSAQIGVQSMTVYALESKDLVFPWDTSGSTLSSHTLTAAVTPVPGESNTANNSSVTESIVRLPGHDAAVIALDAPVQITEGDIGVVTVTAANNGTFTESETVTLVDQSSGLAAGPEQTVVLQTGEMLEILFSWDTSGLDAGLHQLLAGATIPLEENPADNSLGMTVQVRPKPMVAIELVDPPGPQPEIRLTFTGTLQFSTDAVSWSDVTPPPVSPWVTVADQPVMLFRVE